MTTNNFPSPGLSITDALLKAAYSSKDLEVRLFERPSQVFEDMGMAVPDIYKDGFDKNFKDLYNSKRDEIRDEIRKALSDNANADVYLPSLASIGCTLCSIAAYTVAAAIVGIGAAGLTLLSVTSGVVVALAAFAGVGASAALAFIAGLSTAIASGISAVCTKICEWTGAC